MVGGCFLGFIVEEKIKDALDKRKRVKLNKMIESIKPNPPRNKDIVVSDEAHFYGLESQYKDANQKVTYLNNLLATVNR